MNLHFETLTIPTRELLASFGRLPQLKDFYLAGGTALALQLGHRISHDLDLFSGVVQLDDVEKAVILEAIGQLGLTTKADKERDRTLHLKVNQISVSLFHYRYPLVRPLIDMDNMMRLAAIEDIGLMKIAAINNRGIRRDFIDLFFICQNLSLESLLELGKKKFPHWRDFSVQAARSLVYFGDAEKGSMPEMLQQVNWEVVKGFFIDELERLGQQWFEID